jgi:Putative Ig domain
MNISKGSRRARAGLAAVGACLTVGGVTLGGQAAQAQSPLPLTPTLDCVTVDSAAGVDIAYFGYANTGPVSIAFGIGEDNQVLPGIADQGQPTVFNVGSYPAVFRVAFDPAITPSVSWILNGLIATASAASPPCAAGITAPASGVTATAATLNGVITPGGTDTTYTFEYGTTTAYGSSTTVTDAGSGDAAELVQAALTGLQPSTTYYFRLDTTNGLTGTVDGPQQTFTTLAPPAPAGMTLATTALPAGTAGTAYSATLSATGGTQPYTWSVTSGHLPRGLRLGAATGVISGTPKQPGTAKFTITVTDSGTPVRESLTARFAITIAK